MDVLVKRRQHKERPKVKKSSVEAEKDVYESGNEEDAEVAAIMKH